MQQAMQGIINALSRKRCQWHWKPGLYLVSAVDYVVIDMRNVGNVKGIAQGSRYLLWSFYCKRRAGFKREVQGYGHIGISNFHALVMIADQKIQLVSQVISKQAGLCNGCRVDAWLVHMAVGQSRVNTCISAVAESYFGVVSAVSAWWQIAIEIERECISQKRCAALVELYQLRYSILAIVEPCGGSWCGGVKFLAHMNSGGIRVQDSMWIMGRSI